jgi:hypothetical protein
VSRNSKKLFTGVFVTSGIQFVRSGEARRMCSLFVSPHKVTRTASVARLMVADRKVSRTFRLGHDQPAHVLGVAVHSEERAEG